MEPIINPSVFYWANVLDSLQKIGILIAGISIIAIMIISIAILLDFDWEKDERVIRISKKLLIAFIIVLAIAIIMIIFIPTKETIYAMCISEVITPNNIDAITEKGEKGVKFIFEQIEQLINNTAATS